MYYILVIFLLLIVLIVFLKRLKSYNPPIEVMKLDKEIPRQIVSDCCGAHEICEFEASIFDEKQIVYFDDEELDELRNVREDQLTASQIDDLREVLYTLRTNEIDKWMISLSRRHIHLPDILKQEARQLMADKD